MWLPPVVASFMADVVRQVQRQQEDLVMHLEGGRGLGDCPARSPCLTPQEEVTCPGPPGEWGQGLAHPRAPVRALQRCFFGSGG